MNDSEVIDPDHGSDVKSAAAHQASELRTAASAKAREFAEAVERQAHETGEVAAEKAEQWKAAAETGWEDAKGRMQDLFQEADAYVRENPGKSVATALGVGFVLGLLFRR